MNNNGRKNSAVSKSLSLSFAALLTVLPTQQAGAQGETLQINTEKAKEAMQLLIPGAQEFARAQQIARQSNPNAKQLRETAKNATDMLIEANKKMPNLFAQGPDIRIQFNYNGQNLNADLDCDKLFFMIGRQGFSAKPTIGFVEPIHSAAMGVRTLDAAAEQDVKYTSSTMSLFPLDNPHKRIKAAVNHVFADKDGKQNRGGHNIPYQTIINASKACETHVNAATMALTK